MQLSIDFADLCRRIDAAYATCVGSIALEKLSHASCTQLHADKAQQGASQGVLRHIEQQASILGHMDTAKLLHQDAVFVELGAGRGMLSLALAQHLPTSQFVLIDRAHTRGKADHLIGTKTTHEPQLVRAKIDIRHLNFGGMPQVVGKRLVGMSKHLCGVATDLSLRAIVNTLPPVDGVVMSPHFQGLAIALCCHHVCTWQDYVNADFFLQQGFRAAEFALVTSMSSWATCGMGLEGDAVERALGIT